MAIILSNGETVEECSREQWITACGSARAAEELEADILSVGRDLLPTVAIHVLEGMDATPAYWGWLIAQRNAYWQAAVEESE